LRYDENGTYMISGYFYRSSMKLIEHLFKNFTIACSVASPEGGLIVAVELQAVA